MNAARIAAMVATQGVRAVVRAAHHAARVNQMEKSEDFIFSLHFSCNNLILWMILLQSRNIAPRLRKNNDH